MGLSISNMLTGLFKKKPARILMASLDGAGKTTILFKLKIGEVGSTIHTIGFNVERIQYKNLYFTIWEFGGGDQVQPIWKKMYPTLEVEALIFVVDSCDRERIGESADKLHGLLEESHFADTMLLLFANKQDLPDSMSPTEIAEKFRLNEMQNRSWQIQACCGVNGEGLFAGLAWLANELAKKSAVK